jgi:hypothetical protein
MNFYYTETHLSKWIVPKSKKIIYIYIYIYIYMCVCVCVCVNFNFQPTTTFAYFIFHKTSLNACSSLENFMVPHWLLQIL